MPRLAGPLPGIHAPWATAGFIILDIYGQAEHLFQYIGTPEAEPRRVVVLCNQGFG